MSDRRKGYQHESNKTADLIENYLDKYEKHTSTNRRLPPQRSSSQRKQSPRRASSLEKRGTYANAPKFDPRVEDVALKSAPAVRARLTPTIGTPRARSADSVLQTSTRKTTSTSRINSSAAAPRIKDPRSGERSSAESRLRKLLTPHYPNTAPTPSTSVRSASLSPTRSFRRDENISSTSRTKRDDELWLRSNKGSAGWQSPSSSTITRKSILRHSIGIDNPRRYRETIDSSSSADSYSFHSDKRVRFEDQVRVKRKIAPSPELVKLVRTDSENSLTSSSSGNLHSNSELSVSSGTGSLPDFHLVDYSLGSEDSSQKSGQSQGRSARQTRQYSSNDSDYSTENESLYGIDRLRKNESHYSSNDSFKSSAYSSSSSVKSSESYSNTKSDQTRPRIKSESSEDEPVQRRIKKIHLKEVHAESDEDAKSDSSNSTLADTSSSESEIVLASGVVITREKFTSGSEFESSAESTEDMSEAENNGKWFMTVKEHRASSPSNFEEEQVMEKEIYFKYKESRGKAKGAEIVEQEHVPEAQFITVENVDFEEIKEVKRPNPTRPKPIKPVQIIVQSVSDSETDRAISITVEKESVKQESRSPQISDLESLKSVTLKDGELDDITDSSLSLTHITTLDGSLTQTSVFTLPLLDRHSPNLEDIKSATESSDSSSTKGVHAPYHLVKQIVKQNEALYQLQQQAKLNKLVSYSCSSLSSNGTDATESLVSLVEDNDPSAFAPGYFYDSFGNKKRVMVSTATSTVFGSGYSLEKPFVSDITANKFKNEEARRTYFNQRATQAPSDIAATEILLLDPISWRKQKTFVSSGVQTDQVGQRRFTLQKQTSAPSAFEQYSRTSTTSDYAERELSRSKSYDKDATTIETDTLLSSIKTDPFKRSKISVTKKKESFVTLKANEKKPTLQADGGRNTRNPLNKKFAYKKEKKEEIASKSPSEADIATAGDGKFVKDFSLSSGTDSVISFHECHEEVISTTDLLESLSSSQSSGALDLSDTEELRVSLKLSRDLSKADTSDNNTSTEESDADSLGPEFSSKTSHLLEDREDDRSRPQSLRTCNSVTSTSSVQSADQRLIEMVMREVEEMIQESKTSSSHDKTPQEMCEPSEDSSFSNGQLNTSDPAESQNLSENVSSYSVGEVVEDPKKSAVDNALQSAEKSQRETREEHQKAASSKELSVIKSEEKIESEFEKLHREMKEMMESGTGSQRSLTSKQSTSNSTLRKIPSITSSTSSSESNSSSKSNMNKVQKSGSSMSFERPSSSAEEQKLDREYDHDDDSDGQIIIETTGIVSDGKSQSSPRFRRKVPASLSSYGTISDPEAILRMSKRSSTSDCKESSKLVKGRTSGNSRSNRNVPRLASLSSTQKCTDIGIVTSNKSKKRNTNSENSGGDSSDNRIGKSTRTSAYSRKLRASSGAPGSAGENGGLVDYDVTQSTTTVSSDSELSPDELDDLVYSLKISKPWPSESEGEDNRTFCENCRTEKSSCECSHTCNSEITDSYRYKRGRWEENYGVVRALKWIFCPCRDG